MFISQCCGCHIHAMSDKSKANEGYSVPYICWTYHMLLKCTNFIFIRSSKSFNISEDSALIVLMLSLYVIWLVVKQLQNDNIVNESVNTRVCMWLSLGLNFWLRDWLFLLSFFLSFETKIWVYEGREEL
jgi:hypothetical protein